MLKGEKRTSLYFMTKQLSANDDEGLQWGKPDTQIIRPKSRGSGIMVSDFITDKDGYLCLTEEEYTFNWLVKMTPPLYTMAAPTLLEYGEGWLLDWAKVHEADGILYSTVI